MTDSELILRAGKGDAAAFRQIAERYAKQVYLLSCSAADDETEGREAVGDIFRTAWNALPLLAPDSSLPEWLASLTCQHFEKKLGRTTHMQQGTEYLPVQRFSRCLTDGCGFDQEAVLRIMGQLQTADVLEGAQSDWETWYFATADAYPKDLPARIAGAIQQDNERYGWRKLLGRFRFTLAALILVLLLLLFSRLQTSGKVPVSDSSSASAAPTAVQTEEAPQFAPDAQLIPGS